MKLFFTPEARRDFESIETWISKDNHDRALTFVEELIAACVEILNHPEKHPLAFQFERKGVRRKVHGNYLIFYRVRATQVEILHVLHGAQDYSRLLD